MVLKGVITLKSSDITENLTVLIKDAAIASVHAHSILFKEFDDSRNEIIAALYINKAISIMSAAKAVYICNIEKIENQEVEEIFNRFDVFESELLTNIATNHSHQWSDIEFNRYKDAFEALLGEL